MIPVSSAAALHSDAAPPGLSAGPASPSPAGSWECWMLRHILEVSDTLLLSLHSVSFIVPGDCAVGGLQQGDQDYTFCRWWGAGLGWSICLEQVGQWAFSELLFGLRESAGCVCKS